MIEYIYVNGRLMQRQPCQQQQGATFRQPPPPEGSPRTILGGPATPVESPHPELDPSARVPFSDDRVISWIKRAVEQTELDPYTYLNERRGKNYRLDTTDDNLAAAERYFEGLQGNYGAVEIRSQGALKKLRDVQVGESKPFESILGKNGSRHIDEVTEWGLAGVADLAQNRTALERIRIGHRH